MISQTILHQNIQSLQNKTLEIECFLSTMVSKPEVLLFSEHWMNKENAAFVKIKGYNLTSLYARDEIKHGGVCIYCRCKSSYKEDRDITNLSIEGEIECTAVYEEKLKVFVMCLYRRGVGVFEVFIQRFYVILEYIYCKYKKYKVIIAGDFNINFLEIHSNNVKKILDMFNVYNFKQCIFKPTRECVKSATLIDNIFCNYNKVTSYVLNTALSDHYSQVIHIQGQNEISGNVKFIYKRVFSKSKMEALKREVAEIDWSDVYNCGTVNEAYLYFLTSIINIFNILFPIKKCILKKSVNYWITTGIKNSCRTKRALYYQRIKGIISNQFFNDYSKILKKVIKEAKKMSNTQYIQNSDNKIKATWKLTKEFTNTNKSYATVLENFYKKYSDPHKIVNNLNNYFINACPVTNSINYNFPVNPVMQSIFLRPVTYNETLESIKTLKNKNSVGDDNLSVKTIKKISEVIAEPLTYIINLCFKTGDYPDLLKNALVKAIHKKGDLDQEANYRPISLLCNIGKIFEKLIYSRFMNFLEGHSIITDKQNGFRKKKSTIRAIYQAVSTVLTSLNKKNVTMAMCMDLSKAFDSVNHDTLSKKLENCGIRGNALLLIKSYLKNRTQQVVENDSYGRTIFSDKVLVTKGVPQGSILGPLLYIIYTNELADITGQYTVLYADDITLIFSDENINTMVANVDRACEILDRYFAASNLLLNVPKTQCLVFGNRKETEFSFTYNGININSLDEVSFLGVQIDKRLDWKTHVESVAKSISKYCYALRVIVDNVGLNAAMSAYYAFIQSKVRYGLIFWGNSTEINRILILQKRCIRSIYNMKTRDSCKNIFIEKKILTVICIYVLDCFMFVLRNSDLFAEFHQKHEYSTRFKMNHLPEKCNFSYIQKNVHYSALKIFNSFPKSLRDLPEVKAKNIVKNYLLSKAFYTLEDFHRDTDRGNIHYIHCT